MNHIKIGSFLKKLRINKELTLEQLAQRFNVSVRDVLSWEADRNMPDLLVLGKLAELYDVDINEIIDGNIKDDDEIKNEGINETLEKISDYTNEYSIKKVKKVWKIVFALALIIILISFLSLKTYFKERFFGDVSNVTISDVSSDIYSQEDIDSAIQTIMDDFVHKWKGCTLEEIYYAGDEISAEYIDHANRNYADEVIVLLSSYYVYPFGGDGSLNTNYTYRDWNWILVRSKGGEWKHVDHGY